MKKVLILGVTGMLGNAMYTFLSKQQRYQLVGTTSGGDKQYTSLVVDEMYISQLRDLLQMDTFDYVINCIGYIRPDASNREDYAKTLLINSHFPQILHKLSCTYGYKLIHFSTDCVFSGDKGGYSDKDLPDELGLYGMSKYLGEISSRDNITLRTSIIGIELHQQKKNLLNWFLSQPKASTIRGFAGCLRNGMTTLTMAKIVDSIIGSDLPIGGLIQLGGQVVSKYELLVLCNNIFDTGVNIEKDCEYVINKTLLPSVEQKLFEDCILPIEQQIIDLKKFYKL